MKEFDIKNYTYKELEYLRRKTILGPFALLKVEKAKKEAYLARKYYQEIENEIIDLDTNIADELEYSYRIRAMQSVLFHEWEKYGNGLSLEEFTDYYVKTAVNENNKKNNIK